MKIVTIDNALKLNEISALFGVDEYARQPDRVLINSVPWLYRAVSLRAGAVASMPYKITDNAGNIVNPFPNFPVLLHNVETALTIYGYAYLFIERSARRILGLRWLAPQTIKPRVDDTKGLVGFDRVLGGKTISLTFDDIVYIWYPNPHAEVEPGVSPVRTTLDAAGIAYNANRFINLFFERGAIGATLLTIDGNPPDADLKRLEAWWRRMVAGVRNAFNIAAVRASVKPIQVGYPLDQLEVESLFSEVRNQICAGLGVPQTLLEDAANYATAVEHRKSFYTETILPECRLIETELNRQLFNKIGLTFQFNPEQLELMQDDEADKAQAVVNLVNSGIMTVSEARHWLGLNNPNIVPTNSLDIDTTELAVQKARYAELRLWRDIVRKNTKRTFKSDILPAYLVTFIETALADGYNPFPLKTVDDDIEQDIAKVQHEIQRVLAEYHPRIAALITAGATTDALIDNMRDDLTKALSHILTEIIYKRIIANSLDTIVVYEPAVINQRALEWSRTYTYNLVTRLTDTTRDVLRNVISQFISTPGMTRDDVISLLEPAFGHVRAGMIATTEVTRAYAEATNTYQQMLAEIGINMTRVWHTNNDDRVCPVCGPLDNEPEERWPRDLQGGPPAHVNCRCTIGLRRQR